VDLGSRSNDLPGTLTLLADHYTHTHALWSRLKGLMVYPAIVVCVALLLTCALSSLFGHFLSGLMTQFQVPSLLLASVWIPPVTMALLAVLGACSVLLPSWRERLRWKLPAFREASLAQLASTMALMLRNGLPLADALTLAQQLESGSPASPALARWKSLVEGGQGNPSRWPAPSAPFPRLFLWLIQEGGEDAAAGFQKAADLYRARASYRTELALYAALPISILLLGQMIFWQIAPLVRSLGLMMNALGS
jgi:type II secretory pathway component PulF